MRTLRKPNRPSRSGRRSEVGRHGLTGCCGEALDRSWGPVCMAINATSRRHARPSSPSPQADLFTAANGLPEGLCYRPNVLSGDEEDGLARELAYLPFKRRWLGGAKPP